MDCSTGKRAHNVDLRDIQRKLSQLLHKMMAVLNNERYPDIDRQCGNDVAVT